VARLAVTFRDGNNENYELVSITTLGRQSANDIPLREDLASRQHARIIPSGRSFIIEDLRSANGTFVNGQKIQRRLLSDGDRIRIGGCELVFEDSGAKDLIGELIAGSYRVLGKLGSGGMGTVYKALQISMDREVALKVLSPELTQDREFVVGFLNEARTAGQLNHPNIIQVHDFGEYEGYYYFSMEMVKGDNVFDILKREGKIAPRRAMTMIRQLCEGLAHAHSNNVVHQDIKPQNMMVDPRGGKETVKMADLGLAQVMGKSKSHRSGMIMGTPHYMAPEQAKGKEVDGRTDIYSTGASLFHMLTGRVPYDGKNSIDTLTQHVKGDVPDPRKYDVSIPEGLALLVMKMMAKDQVDRPQKAEEIIKSIDEILDVQKKITSGRPTEPAVAPVVRQVAVIAPRGGAGRRIQRKRRKGAGLLPWILLLLLAGVAYFGWKYLKEQEAKENNVPVNGLSASQIEQYFKRARTTKRAGHLYEAEQYLRNILDGTEDSAVRNQARSQLDKIGLLRQARREYEDVLRKIKNYPDRKKNAIRELQDFVLRYPGVPEAADARARLVKLRNSAGNSSGNGNGSGGTPSASLEDEASRKYVGVLASARAHEAKQEFFAGERVLLDFSAMYTGTQACEKAKVVARELASLGDTLLAELLSQAAKHASGKKFRQANNIYNRVIALDPGGKWGKKAREALTAQDVARKAFFDKAWKRAMEAFNVHSFGLCANMAAEASVELENTRWQHRLDRLTIDAMLSSKAHAAMVDVIEKHGKRVRSPFVVPGAGRGTITGVDRDAMGLSVRGGPATITVKWSDMTSEELEKVYLAFPIPAQHHLGLGVLLMLRGRKDAAFNEFRRARLVSATKTMAERRIAEVEGRANMLSYDFTSGLQMFDWKALSGKWGIKGGALTGGATGEGLIELRKARYSAIGLTATFEFSQSPGSIVAFELFSSANDHFEITFDPARGVGLSATIAGAPTSRIDKTALAAGKMHKVKIEARGNELILTLDGRKLAPLSVVRLVGLRGKLRLKVLDGTLTVRKLNLLNSEK
jgi:pSer/pThr/pTyr-binding forkhead associated (FHA) protein/tetratricopeptide (TPR) repeat protein